MFDKNAGNHLTVRKKIRSASLKCYEQNGFTKHIFNIYGQWGFGIKYPTTLDMP